MTILAALLASWDVSGLIGTFAYMLTVGCGARDFPMRSMILANLWGTVAIFTVALAAAS